MNIKWGYLIIVLLLLFACNEKLIKKPEHLISKEKMVEVIKDLAIANAAKSTNIALLRENNIDPTTFVLEKHGIDSTQFVKSDLYYASLPGGVYEAIYKTVEEKLEKETERLEAARKVSDSLAAEGKRQKNQLKPPSKQVNDSLP